MFFLFGSQIYARTGGQSACVLARTRVKRTEFAKNESEFSALARTCFSPRRRCEPKISSSSDFLVESNFAFCEQ